MMNFGELGAPDPLLINRPGGQAADGMHHFGGNVAASHIGEYGWGAAQVVLLLTPFGVL
jgi:hypothetical protein